MLLRDGDDGIEVFMQQRNHQSEFVAGLYVFPGGGVDPEDSDPALSELCQGWTDAQASARIGESSGGLAFFVAAVRETFEEAGLLLAVDSNGDKLRLEDPAETARFAEHRRAVDQAGDQLLEVLRAEGLQLDLRRMEYHSRWITPLGPKRRYDVRFLVAPMPEGQVASKDGREAIADLWVSPADAVEREARGELNMLIPTLASLRELATHDTVEAAIDACIGREVAAILPKIVMGPEGRRALLPGDDGYEDA